MVKFQIAFRRILSIFTIIQFGEKNISAIISASKFISEIVNRLKIVYCARGSSDSDRLVRKILFFGSAYADVVGADLTGTYIELNYYYTKYRFLCFTHYITVKLLQIFG